MDEEIDPGIIALFGGATRVLTLAVLSSTTQPLTGYRVVKLTGAQPIKVYNEIKRLAGSGLVARARLPDGRFGWSLTDPDIRGFFRRRVRLNWPSPGVGEVMGSNRNVRRRQIRGLDVSSYRPNARKVPNRVEFSRPPEKDEALASVGLRTSRRRGSAT